MVVYKQTPQRGVVMGEKLSVDLPQPIGPLDLPHEPSKDSDLLNVEKLILNQILKRELERRSLSVNKLARECGISFSVLHSWVQGVSPSAKNLHLIKRLGEYLGLSTDALLWGEGVPSNKETLYDASFSDEGRIYKLRIEKVKK